jgi:hypothetical protein
MIKSEMTDANEFGKPLSIHLRVDATMKTSTCDLMDPNVWNAYRRQLYQALQNEPSFEGFTHPDALYWISSQP